MLYSFPSASFSPLERNTDVVFLIDASKDVTNVLLQRQKEFVNLLYDYFNLSPAGPRGSALAYGGYAYSLARFLDISFKEKVNRASLLRSSRRMDLVLERASVILAQRGKDDSRKIVILLTAGKQPTQAKDLQEAIKPLQSLGAQTFVIAFGPNVNNREFEANVEQMENIIRVPESTGLKDRSKPIALQIRGTAGKIYVTFLFPQCHCYMCVQSISN